MKFLVGLILGFILLPALAYWYASSGRMPVATSEPPLPMERKFTSLALHAVVGKEAPQTVPIQADEGAYLAGAEVYRNNCAVCHGVPGGQETGIAKGEFPHPPQLFETDEMVTDDPPGVTFWKAKHGIRLTGMPGFEKSLSDTQLWDLSVLLANADKIPPAVRQALTATSPAPGQSK